MGKCRICSEERWARGEESRRADSLAQALTAIEMAADSGASRGELAVIIAEACRLHRRRMEVES